MKKKNQLRIAVLSLMVMLSGTVLVFAEGGHIENLGKMLPIWSIAPFVGMLLSIAICPLVNGEWWEKRQGMVAALWSVVFIVPFMIAYGVGAGVYQLLEVVLLDYLPFIVLLFGLFAVAGGIQLKGSLAGSPKVNLILLLIGAVLASWIGTTGASMLLIRPVIKANKWREKKAHVIIFFIFMVSNIGGCLTPVGDPPLFLGFLRGVPFFWTMKLLPMWLFNIAILAVVLFIIDNRLYKKELAAGRRPQDILGETKEPLKVEGALNFVFIGLIVFAVILSGLLADVPGFVNAAGEATGITIYGVTLAWTTVVEVILILIAAFLSCKLTKKEIRDGNEFSWGPIKEVATLFIGIFITMIPALAILKANGAALGLDSPWQFFWATGALSSFLDNAPTYLVFMTTAGALGATEGLATAVGTIAVPMLMAVSAGAVFMGANTYIGNAPNFMVRSIAEENKIKMPSFFGYMGWSVAFLIPLFIIDTLVFFL